VAVLFHLYTTCYRCKIILLKNETGHFSAVTLSFGRTKSVLVDLINILVRCMAGYVYYLNNDLYSCRVLWLFVYYIYNLGVAQSAQKIEISVIGSYLSQNFYWHKDCR
jgi:hypothetical protein